MTDEHKENKEEEYLNNWKRAAADLANYKKDEMERMGTLLQYSKADLIEKVLPVFDSIYLAQKSLPDDAGIAQIIKQIVDFLKKEGIEEIKVVGEKFNAETMEIVAASAEASTFDKSTAGQAGEPQEEIVVVEELQKGYMMQGKVLRVARVKVNK